MTSLAMHCWAIRTSDLNPPLLAQVLVRLPVLNIFSSIKPFYLYEFGLLKKYFSVKCLPTVGNLLAADRFLGKLLVNFTGIFSYCY